MLWPVECFGSFWKLMWTLPTKLYLLPAEKVWGSRIWRACGGFAHVVWTMVSDKLNYQRSVRVLVELTISGRLIETSLPSYHISRTSWFRPTPDKQRHIWLFVFVIWGWLVFLSWGWNGFWVNIHQSAVYDVDENLVSMVWVSYVVIYDNLQISQCIFNRCLLGCPAYIL